MLQPTKLPWWQVTKTVRSAYIWGSVWLFLSVSQLIIRFIDDAPPHWYSISLYSLMALMSLSYFASGVMQSRRAQRAGDRAASESKEDP